MKKFSAAALAALVLMLGSTSLWAANITVGFQSREPWRSARWYLLGETQGAKVRWLNGAESPITASAKCAVPKQFSEGKLQSGQGEVLFGSKGWMAVPVDPARGADVLTLKGLGCHLTVNMKWSAQAKAGNAEPVPYLFLTPQNNVYMGHEFQITVPGASTNTDITLDLLGGGWVMQLGNSEAGAKESLILLPVVEARGEWVPPSLRGFGMELQLLQTLASFGGMNEQNLLLSEWMAGIFYQRVFSVGQGMAWSLHFDYFQRVADQGVRVESVGPYEADHQNLLVGLSMTQYFSKRWQFNLRGDYGLPSTLADRGLKQKLLRVRSHVGYLLTDSVTLLVEGAYRRYGYEGFSPTTGISLSSGLRLEF